MGGVKTIRCFHYSQTDLSSYVLLINNSFNIPAILTVLSFVYSGVGHGLYCYQDHKILHFHVEYTALEIDS